MKTKLFLIGLIMAAVCFSSCEPRNDGADGKLTEKDLNNYIAALSHYYPYSINDDFIFLNESSGEKWENKPFVYDGDSVYPEAEIWLCDEPDAFCDGDRSASISSYFIENGVSKYEYDPSHIITSINQSGSVDVNINWSVKLSLGAYDYYTGFYMADRAPREVLAQLTDTIIIPILRQGTASGVIAAPDGAYARIVKNKGITDFSTDGITIWRRVEE